MSNRNFDLSAILRREQARVNAQNLYAYQKYGRRIISNPQISTPDNDRIYSYDNGVQTQYFKSLESRYTVSPSGILNLVENAGPATVPDIPIITQVIPDDKSIYLYVEPAMKPPPITNYTYSFDNITFIPFNPAVTESPLIITGLNNGQTYTVYICAVNEVGPSLPTDGITATPVAAPDPPTINTVTPGNAQVIVNFTPGFDGGPPVSGFTVTSSPGGITATGLASPITVTGLTNGQEYTFTMTATNAKGDSPPSVPSAPVIPFTTPNFPTINTVTPGNAQLTVQFTPPIFNGGRPITGYTYALNGGIDVPTSPLGNQFIITGLNNGQPYSVTMKAVNLAGPSSVSNTVSGTPVTVPGAPTIKSVIPANSSLTVVFSASTTTGGSPITDYQYSTDGTNYVSIGLTNTFTIPDLTNGQQYPITMKALNIAGLSPISNIVYGTPFVGGTEPSAPVITEIATGNGILTACFTLASDGGSPITNYAYSTDGSTYTDFDPAITESPVMLTGLTNGTPQTIQIKAQNDIGYSNPSNTVTATPNIVTFPTISNTNLVRLEGTVYNGRSIWTNSGTLGTAGSGSLVNTPTYSLDQGNAFGSFSFNNTQSEYVDMGTNIALRADVGVYKTAMVWMRVNFLTGGALIGKEFGSPSFDGFSVEFYGTNALGIRMNGANRNDTPNLTGWHTADNIFNLNEWTMVTAIICFGGGRSTINPKVPTQLYINDQTTPAINVLSTEIALAQKDAPLQLCTTIGGNYSSVDIGAFYYFDGIVSQADIATIYDATKARYNVC